MSRVARVGLITALAATAGLTVVLAVQNRGLEARYAEIRERARHPHAGLYLPSLRPSTLTGDSVILAAESNPAREVLFYFNTTCPYCLLSLPAWKEIARRVQQDGVVTVGLSLDSETSTRAYAKKHGLNFPVAVIPDARSRALLRAHLVPQTLVVGGNGRVLLARTGSLQSTSAIDSILEAATAPMTLSKRRPS